MAVSIPGVILSSLMFDMKNSPGDTVSIDFESYEYENYEYTMHGSIISVLIDFCGVISLARL